jgi:hypothetical protein
LQLKDSIIASVTGRLCNLSSHYPWSSQLLTMTNNRPRPVILRETMEMCNSEDCINFLFYHFNCTQIVLWTPLIKHTTRDAFNRFEQVHAAPNTPVSVTSNDYNDSCSRKTVTTLLNPPRHCQMKRGRRNVGILKKKGMKWKGEQRCRDEATGEARGQRPMVGLKVTQWGGPPLTENPPFRTWGINTTLPSPTVATQHVAWGENRQHSTN